MAHTQLLITFDDDEAAARWFVTARAGGTLPAGAGLAHADALDLSGRRGAVGALIVTAADGRSYVVHPPADADPSL